MSLPHQFANLGSPPNPPVPMSYLDDNFNALPVSMTIWCSTTGTTTYTLSPAANQPPLATAYATGQLFGFVAGNTSTGTVTAAISGVNGGSAYPIYKDQAGSTQAGAGDITANRTYILTWNPNVNTGVGGFVMVYPATAVVSTPVLRSYLAGLTLSNDGVSPNTVLDIAAGVCTDSTNAVSITLGAFTKSTGGSWVAGSGSNGMGNGLVIANSTWYHVFAIVNSGSPDVYFDTSVSAANKPVGTTAFRRIGSFKTDGSAHILAFTQNGPQFLWASPVTDVSGDTTLGTTQKTYTLPSVPSGVVVKALLTVVASNSLNPQSYVFYSPAQSPTLYNLVSPVTAIAGRGQMEIWTNAAQQINARSDAAANNTVFIAVSGYTDMLGQFA